MARKTIVRLPRYAEDDGKTITLNELEFYYHEDTEDFKYKTGIIKKEDLKEDLVKKEKDTFSILEPSHADYIQNLKRKAQVMTLKDIGPIIAYTGLNKSSKVIDAGTGSGSLAGALTAIAKEIRSYDSREDHLEAARKNLRNIDTSNLSLEVKDIKDKEQFPSGEFDVFTLDIKHPEQALETAEKVLKKSGYLVVYSPHITQIQSVKKKLPENLVVVKTMEIIEREWKVGDKILRPQTKDHGHTGFLCFIRKIF